MQVLFDSNVHVHYGFIKLQHEDADPIADLDGAWTVPGLVDTGLSCEFSNLIDVSVA